MSSSFAQVPSAVGERAIANVGAFPFTVVEGGPQGEDVIIPSGSTVTRSRSTPERGSAVDIPPGLGPRQSRDEQDERVRHAQFHFTVRQQVASIEQQLLQLRNMSQFNTQNQQVQNNLFQVNMDNPLTSEVAQHALEVQQQAIQHAHNMQANAHFAEQRAALASHEAQAQVTHVTQLAQQEIQRTQQLAQDLTQQQASVLESRAQQLVSEQAEVLQQRARQALSESRISDVE